jgi:hypothetical protein
VETLHRAVKRLPLVARPRPACLALDVRVREVVDLAQGAARATEPNPLPMATAAHNQAALIASDCGMPELARSLCWRQFRVHGCSRPLNGRAARFALQPLVNLARLQLRSGDGVAANRLLDTLYEAVRSGGDAMIEGHPLSFRGFTSSVEAHHTVCRWLWTVLLADGTRALAVAGEWEQALAFVQRHRGIGMRLLDGRQVAIVARILGGEPAAALALLERTVTPTLWERCVAAILNMVRLEHYAQPAVDAARSMAAHYLALPHVAELLAFQVRLGLAVIDLAGGLDCAGARQVTTRVVAQAMAAADGYAARDLLSHAVLRAQLAEHDERALAVIVQSAGLGCGTMPTGLLADLLSAAAISEDVIAHSR